LAKDDWRCGPQRDVDSGVSPASRFNYKRFRELTDEWVELVVELEQQEQEQNQ
jgi:hypothetical protein